MVFLCGRFKEIIELLPVDYGSNEFLKKLNIKFGTFGTISTAKYDEEIKLKRIKVSTSRRRMEHHLLSCNKRSIVTNFQNRLVWPD